MFPKIKISVNIVPFGSIKFETPEMDSPVMDSPVVETKQDILPQYVQPLTTNVERFEIQFGVSEIYIVPKTTASL